MAFDPHGTQRMLDLGRAIFALVRMSPTGKQRVLCIQSVSNKLQTVKVDFEEVFGLEPRGGWLLDLIQGKRFNIRRKTPLHLRPYQTLSLIQEKKVNE